MRKKICSKCGNIADKNHKCSSIGKVIQARQRKHDKDYDNSDSMRWRKFRRTILSRDGYICVRCWQKFNILNNKSLEVHHIKPKKEYSHLTYEEDNCITVCKSCHSVFKDKDELDFNWNKNNVKELVL